MEWGDGTGNGAGQDARNPFLCFKLSCLIRIGLDEIPPGSARCISIQRTMQLGITIASYAFRSRQPPPLGFAGVEDVVDHCRALGAGGLQTHIGNWDAQRVSALRKRLDNGGLYLEGQVPLPREKSDLDRFDRQIQTARDAGADIVRTVCLGGRRYETFHSAADFADFVRASRQSLEWAEPIMRRHKVRLAVENHKDWRVPGLLELMKHLDSEWVGVCVDTGNSISLLEDPMAILEAYAPWAFTTHIKDMGVQAYEDGFLLSEVPFGEGFLDVKRMVSILRAARPHIRFNLEMITRDPLRIPCLKEEYWATFGTLPAQALAQTLALVQAHPPRAPLPTVTGRSPEDQVRFEEQNVQACFTFAQKHLEL